MTGLFRTVVGEFGIGGTKAGSRFLIAYLLLSFLVIDLQLVERVEGGRQRDVCSWVRLLQTSLSVSGLLFSVLLYPIFVGLAFPLDVGDLIMWEVATGSWNSR